MTRAGRRGLGIGILAAAAMPVVGMSACADAPVPVGAHLAGTSSGASSTGSSSSASSSSSGKGGAGSSSTSSTGSSTSSTGSSTSSTGSSSSSTGSSSSGAGGMGGMGAGGSSTSSSGGGTDAGDAGDAAPCSTDLLAPPLQAGIHLPLCIPIQYPTNPPTSGPHYPIWAAFKTYTSPIPRGFWVHDLEHGAIVITYNCPGSCAADLAALQAWIDARPADPLCVAPLTNRIVVTPDPLLDVKFAASAWGFALKSNCFDLVGLGAFMDAHYGMAPENFCSDGADLSLPGAFPAGCGEIPDGGSSDAPNDADAAD